MFQLPEYVGVREPVHELDLPEHVGSVTGQDVHLQSHYLTRHAMLHLDQNNNNNNTQNALCSTTININQQAPENTLFFLK